MKRIVWIWIGLIAAAVIAGSIYYVTAQDSDSYSLPPKFCSAATDPDTLEPLLPEGTEIAEDSDPVTAVKQRDSQGRYEEHVDCRLLVDGRQAVEIDITASERQQDLHPEDYTAVQRELPAAREVRSSSFDGRAVIGANGALIRATCETRYHSLVLHIDVEDGHRPTNSTSRRELQRWIDDFIPKLTSKTGCTT